MSEVIEEFGFESSSEIAAPEPTTDDPGELQDLINELTKQAAETDDGEQKDRLRACKKAAQERLDSLVAATSKSKTQWTDLSKAFSEFYKNGEEFKTQLTAAGGISSEAFETLRHALAEAHAAKKAKPRNSKKDKTPITEPPPTPQSRLEHIRLHAKNLGFSADAVMAEMGFTEPTDESMGELLREINQRAHPQAEVVEEFGVGEPGEVTCSASATTVGLAERTADSTSATDSAITASGTAATAPSGNFWDEQMKELIDPDTGEVIQRHWFLEKLELPDFPVKPDKEIAAKILDVMHSLYIDRAARYRAQAAKMAAPLETKAAFFEKVFGPYLDACGAEFLPRYQKGAKAGEFSKKTLDLITGSISWRKDGGVTLVNPAEWQVWLGQQKQHMQELVAAGDADSLEELASMANVYGLKLETKAIADKDKVKELEALPPGWADLEVDEFATRTIK